MTHNYMREKIAVRKLTQTQISNKSEQKKLEKRWKFSFVFQCYKT
jgi:hypothetical protein